MKRKTRIFFIFFILSITPFFRGCNFTLGFPAPIVNLWPSLEALREYIQDTPWVLKAQALSLLIFNISLAYLLAKFIMTKGKNIRGISSFLNALVFNICFNWSAFFLASLKLEENYGSPTLKEILLKAYVNLYLLYNSGIPEEISFKINRLLGIKFFTTEYIITKDILVRIWFVLTALFLAAILYNLKEPINKAKSYFTS